MLAAWVLADCCSCPYIMQAGWCSRGSFFCRAVRTRTFWHPEIPSASAWAIQSVMSEGAKAYCFGSAARSKGPSARVEPVTPCSVIFIKNFNSVQCSVVTQMSVVTVTI